jgi:hypothetical protein
LAEWFVFFAQHTPGRWAKFNDVHQSFPEIPARTLSRDLGTLVASNVLRSTGALKGRRYQLRDEMMDEINAGRSNTNAVAPKAPLENMASRSARSRVRGTVTRTKCGPACWNARSAVCHCECGGSNHGTGRPARIPPGRHSGPETP